MKLCTTHSQETFTAELTNDHPASIPGTVAIQRSDTGEIIALRDILGVPGVSNQKYQLLEITPTEKERLDQAGIVVAETVNDLQNWYKNWDGPKV